MAKLINVNLMVLAIIGGMLLFLGANKNMVVAVCQGDNDMQELIVSCGKYVEKSMPKANPSQDCCDAVKKANFTCVCENVTKEILQWVDMDKVIFVAKSCARPLPSGAKCGGVTVPMPMSK